MIVWHAEWRLEPEGLAGVGADAFGAPVADHVALFGEKRDEFGIGAGDVGAVFFYVEEGGGVGALRPIGTHQDPGTGFDSSVLRFPSFDMFPGEQEIGVGGNFF